MKVVRCADACGARVTLAATHDVNRLLAVCFELLNASDLMKRGWSYVDGRLLCRFCARRRRLIRALPPLRSDVTDAPPPTDEKK